MKTAIVVALSTFLFASPALADQCQLVNRNQFEYARSLINKDGLSGRHIMEICEPCGDYSPRFTSVYRLDYRNQGGMYGSYEFAVNGRPLDLAYAYVRTGPRRYSNLAWLVGCPTTGVRPEFHF